MRQSVRPFRSRLPRLLPVQIRRLSVPLALLSALLMLLPLTVVGQDIEVDIQDEQLRRALQSFQSQTGVNLVYAERLIDEEPVVTCQYRGDSMREALECLLQGVNLRADHVRRQQYVLVAAEGNGPDAPVRAPMAGWVTDAETGEGLPGAHIFLRGLDQGAVSNDAGYFALPNLPAGPYRVRISYVGYETKDTTLVAGGAAASLELQPRELRGSQVTVEADRRDRPDLNVLPGVVNAPMQYLEELPSYSGESDLLQALQWMPGIQRSGELTGGMVVRGGQSDQNLYLLDGAPVYHPWHAFNVVSTFQTETFKNINLYRDAFPAEYGGRLSSVLDAEMRDGNRSGTRGVAGLSLLSGRLMLETPVTDDISVMISARRSYIDQVAGSRHPVEQDGVRDTLRTGYFFYDVSAKATYRPSANHRLSLTYYGGGDNLDLRLPFDLSLDFTSWLRPASLFFELDHDWGNQLMSARYQYLPSDRLFITSTAYASSYRARERALIRPSELSTIDSAYDIDLLEGGVGVDIDYFATLEHQVRAGVQVKRHVFNSTLDARVQRSPGAVDTIDDESQLRAVELSAYVQDTWQPTSRWTIQPGLRFSYFSSGAHTHLRPRLNARYAVIPGLLSARAGVGLHVQYLHQLKDRSAFLHNMVSNRWIPSDSDVRPSTSRHISGGVELYPADWLTLSVESYLRTASNILIPRDEFQRRDGLVGSGVEVGSLLGQYEPGSGRAFGVEVGAEARSGPWTVHFAYHGGQSRSRSRALGEEDFRPTRFDVPHALQTMVKRTTNRWEIGLSTELRNGFPESVPEARFGLGDVLEDEPTLYLHRPEVNNGRLPAYWRADLSVAYRFGIAGSPVKAQVNLYNVLGRRNIVSRRYDPSPEAGVAVQDRRGIPLIPLFELQVEL